MRKRLIEVGRRCVYFYGGDGDTETLHPKGAASNYLTERAKRREKRHQARCWRYDRHGLTPGIEIHTV